MNIRTKSVGFLDAYEDTQFLKECFIETKCYQSALSADTNYICGRRGSGKSAIVLRLQSSERYRYYEDVKGEQFYRQLLHSLHSTPVEQLDKRFLFQTIWKHLILTSAMNVVVNDHKNVKKIPIELRTIIKYLKKNDFLGNRPLSLWEKSIGAIVSIVREHSTKSDYINIVFKFLSNLIENTEFHEAEVALKKYLNKDRRCLIVVDTILDQFQREDIFIECVEGLIYAVLDLTSVKYCNYLEVKCCIPGEIYSHLNLYEGSKINDHLVFLDWRVKDLIRMISKRLFYHLVLLGIEKKSEFQSIEWDDYKTVKRAAWGRYFKNEISNLRNIDEPTHLYILRHTQLTPRELIRIVNTVVNDYEELSDSIKFAVHDSISHTVRELLISNSFIMPNLENVIEQSFRGKKKIMSIDEARKCIATSKTFWKGLSEAPMTEDTIIDNLFRIGFFGVVVNEHEENTHIVKTKFAYMTPDKINLTKNEQLAIHPIFYERFDISPVANKIVYPVRHQHDRWLNVY